MARPKNPDREAVADVPLTSRFTQTEVARLTVLLAQRVAQLRGTGARLTAGGLVRAIVLRELDALGIEAPATADAEPAHPTLPGLGVLSAAAPAPLPAVTTPSSSTPAPMPAPLASTPAPLAHALLTPAETTGPKPAETTGPKTKTAAPARERRPSKLAAKKSAKKKVRR